jgi:hypothetical protein
LPSARSQGQTGRLNEAMIQYEKAARSLDILKEAEVTEMTAELFREMAWTAEQGATMHRRTHSIELKLEQELVTDSEQARVTRPPPSR